MSANIGSHSLAPALLTGSDVPRIKSRAWMYSKGRANLRKRYALVVLDVRDSRQAAVGPTDAVSCFLQARRPQDWML